jgi:hypothetical protein
MRRGPLALALALVGLVAVVAAVLLSTPREIGTPSPSPTASPTTSPSPAASPTTSSGPLPSPTPQGLYMSKKLGFALELPPPWHRAICGNIDPVEDGFTGVTSTIEQFTSAGPTEEFIGHIGTPNDRITVSVDPDPQGRTPRQLAEAGFSGPNTAIKDVTLAGRLAIEVDQGGDQFYYFLADGDRTVQVGYMTFRPASEPRADTATMQRIVRSFRFLSAAERQALPDPTPIPAAAPTAQALAGMLKAALEGKDVAALERLLGPCVNVGGQNAGASNLTRERYISQLRAQFAAGLTVTVDASAIRTEEGFRGTTVRSRWNAVPAGELATPPSPGPQAYDVELVLGKTAGGFFWRGTLVTFRPPG